MRRYIGIWILLFTGTLSLWRCGRQPTETEGSALLSVRLVYSEAASKTSDSIVMKQLAVDEVRVLVADITEWDLPGSFWETEGFSDMLDDFDEHLDEEAEWADWTKVIGDHFPIVSNVSLSIEDETAQGSVSGVIGLNLVLIALLEDGVTQHWGRETIVGIEGQTSEAIITAWEWPSPWWGPIPEIQEPEFNVIATIPVGEWPTMPTITPDGSVLYVPNAESNTISVISTESKSDLADPIPVDAPPGELAMHPEGTFFYMTNQAKSSIVEISTATNTIVWEMQSGELPQDPTITPDGSLVYIPNNGEGSVSVLSTADHEILGKIYVPAAPLAAVVEPGGNFVYVTHAQTNFISVISTSTQTFVDTLLVGTGAQKPVFPTTSSLPYGYVSMPGSNEIIVIDTHLNTRSGTLNVNSRPGTPGIAPDGYKIYIPQPRLNSVVVYSGDTHIFDSVVVNVPNPGTPVIGDLVRYAFVPDEAGGAVSVIDRNTNTVIDRVNVGLNPETPVVFGNYVYVANSGSGTVSVIEIVM